MFIKTSDWKLRVKVKFKQENTRHLDNFHILVQSVIHKLCTRTYFYITLMMYYDVFKVDKALEPSVLLFSEM